MVLFNELKRNISVALTKEQPCVMDKTGYSFSEHCEIALWDMDIYCIDGNGYHKGL